MQDITVITKEEVLKLAKIANITLADNEVEPLTKQLTDVLSYAERVTQNAAYPMAPLHAQCNVWRADEVTPFDCEKILELAPQTAEHFFVVPSILKK